jgi:hypothetical protein
MIGGDGDARDRASAWLALADIGNAAAAWELAGAQFRDAITRAAWTDRLGVARGPLGPLTSRVLAVEQHVDGLPGAPPGEYAVLQYHAVYDGRRAVTETVTLVREPDAQWHVVGYFIR